jgi:hypothetical protein
LILLAAFSARGAIVVTPEIAVADPRAADMEGDQQLSAIVSDGNDFVVFWGGTTGLSAAHVGDDGRFLSRITLPGTAGARSVSASWTGAVYVATWYDPVQRATLAATFSHAGNLLAGPTLIASLWTNTGSLATAGRRALVICLRLDQSVSVVLFDADASSITVIHADLTLPPVTATSHPYYLVPAVASDGHEFVILWRTYAAGTATLHLVRVGSDGDIVATPIVLGTTGTDKIAVAYGGGQYAIATAGSNRLFRFIVDTQTGTARQLQEVDLSGDRKDNVYSLASVFWSGSRFIASMVTESWDKPDAIETLPFSGEGSGLPPVTLLKGPYLFRLPPLFATNGRTVFGAWAQYGDPPAQFGSKIYGSLFDEAASITVRAETTNLISVGWSRQSAPVIATSGTDSLVVWVEESGDRVTGRLLGARLDTSGSPIDHTPFEIAPVVPLDAAAIAFTGDRYFVAWPAQHGIGTRTVNRDGSLGAPVFIETIGDVVALSAVSNSSGTTLLVTSDTYLDIHGYRFDTLGRPIDNTPLLIGYFGYYWVFAPQIASSGSDFLVVWSEGKDFSYCNPVCDWPPTLIDVFGKRVSAAGSVDAAPISIATGPKDQILLAVGSAGRDYLIAHLLRGEEGGKSFARINTKRVLREGQLDGMTAEDDGTTITEGIGGGDYRTGVLAGDAGGYWFAHPALAGSLIRIDPTGKVITGRTTLGISSPSISMASVPGGAVRIAYARRTPDLFDGTSRIFVRSAGEPPTRPRAVRH